MNVVRLPAAPGLRGLWPLLRTRDPELAALRRSCRAGILAPGLFAIGTQVIGNTTLGLFAAFGSISLLLFVDFGGQIRDRVFAQAALCSPAPS